MRHCIVPIIGIEDLSTSSGATIYNNKNQVMILILRKPHHLLPSSPFKASPQSSASPFVTTEVLLPSNAPTSVSANFLALTLCSNSESSSA